MLYIAKRHAGNAFQRVKVCKIGNSWYPDHCNINLSDFLISVKPVCKAVLVLHLDIKIRSNAYHRDPTFFFQHFHTRIKNGFITAEFIDDQTFYHFPFVRFQKLYRSVKLGKHTASVNISHKENRRLCHFCHAHVYNIFCFQIDLRRAACALDHNNVIFRSKGFKGLHHIRHQFFLIFKIISGAHGSKHLAVDDHLGSHIIGRFQKNGIHENRRGDSCCLCLHHLSSSHFKPFLCNKRIQRHIL